RTEETDLSNALRGEEVPVTEVGDEAEVADVVVVENDYGEVFLNEEKVTANLLQMGEPLVESDVWYLDNCASNHMTRHRSKFHKLDESVSGRVMFRDGSKIAIMGKGSILFD
ncbi:hypothetical protein Tco_0258478, partial [Tanacetum coccineum]